MNPKATQLHNDKTERAPFPISNGVEAQTYNSEGKVTGKIELPSGIFGLPWNADLVHQVTVSMQSNARPPVAHTKGAGEVRGGGKKPWQQKGTGRARHGSSRSPLWKGGGVTHGPRNEKVYARKINRKMRLKALYTVLSRKFRDNEIIFIDAMSFDAPKTSNAIALLHNLGKAGFEAITHKKNNAALFVLPRYDLNTVKSFRNIGKVTVEEARNLNPVTLLGHKYLVVSEPQVVVDTLAKRSGEEGSKVTIKENTKETKTRKAKAKVKTKKAA